MTLHSPKIFNIENFKLKTINKNKMKNLPVFAPCEYERIVSTRQLAIPYQNCAE